MEVGETYYYCYYITFDLDLDLDLVFLNMKKHGVDLCVCVHGWDDGE